MPKRAYPYLPEGRTILYAPEDNEFILIARQNRQPLIEQYPSSISTSSIIIKDGKVIGSGTNKPIHKSFCPRTVFDSASGEDYELCPKYCHSDNHSEASAIRDAISKGLDIHGADIYLYGHWWLCKPCWDKIIEAGINNVYLVEGAEDKFFQEVSSKGEPLKSVKIFVEGQKPSGELKERFKKVLISFTDDPKQADFVFKPQPGLSERQFAINLSSALEPYYNP
ncbi:MAG: hypothetical protein HYV13_00105 [Candidatus Doudnabacteria bacterium]|nr:hypothetical protein [Candidatus Doudnabacteria bacterium]